MRLAATLGAAEAGWGRKASRHRTAWPAGASCHVPPARSRLDAVLHVPEPLVQLAGAGAVVVHAQPLLQQRQRCSAVWRSHLPWSEGGPPQAAAVSSASCHQLPAPPPPRPAPHCRCPRRHTATPTHLCAAAALEGELVVGQLLLQVRRQAPALQPHHKPHLTPGGAAGRRRQILSSLEPWRAGPGAAHVGRGAPMRAASWRVGCCARQAGPTPLEGCTRTAALPATRTCGMYTMDHSAASRPCAAWRGTRRSSASTWKRKKEKKNAFVLSGEGARPAQLRLP